MQGLEKTTQQSKLWRPKMKIKEFKEDLRYALGRFDWGNSPLDAQAIKTLNEWEKNLDELIKKRDQRVAEIIEGCKTYRDVFLIKKEVIRKLEDRKSTRLNSSHIT